MTTKEIKYYERINSTFIGRKIVEIFYEELDCETDAEFWEHSTDIHSIDMNIIFRLENNELIQIKWDSEFYSYGIGFEKLNTLTKKDGLKTIQLTEHPKWIVLIGKEITEIIVLWDKSYSQEIGCVNNKFVYIEEKKNIKLPQTWQIEFGNEKIWISALEIQDGKNDYHWADHLTILFTNKEQEKYKLIKNSKSKQYVSDEIYDRN